MNELRTKDNFDRIIFSTYAIKVKPLEEEKLLNL